MIELVDFTKCKEEFFITTLYLCYKELDKRFFFIKFDKIDII